MQVKLDGNVKCELTVPMYDKQANFPVSSTDDQQQRTRHKGTVQNVINKREFAKAVDRKGSYNINNNNNGKEACKQTHINRCKSKCSNVACKQSHKHTYKHAYKKYIYVYDFMYCKYLCIITQICPYIDNIHVCMCVGTQSPHAEAKYGWHRRINEQRSQQGRAYLDNLHSVSVCTTRINDKC